MAPILWICSKKSENYFFNFKNNDINNLFFDQTFWEFKMIPITFNQMMLNSIPLYYMGRWRAIFLSEFEIDGKVVNECKRVYGDIFED